MCEEFHLSLGQADITMWRLGIFLTEGTMWSANWAGATSPRCGWPGTSSKSTLITESICEFVRYKSKQQKKKKNHPYGTEILSEHKTNYVAASWIYNTVLLSCCLVHFFSQRKAICGHEGCKKCWTLHRDSSGWDQAAQVCKSRKNSRNRR